VAGDIVSSYRRISLGLVEGLRILGCDVVQAGPRPAHEGSERSAACFDLPAHFEVTAQGRKLIGSAQLRRRGAVLQHGALPLAGDVARLSEVLALPVEKRSALRRHLSGRAIALDEALGRVVTWDEAASALSEGFSRALNLDLRPGELSGCERSERDRLRSKYLGVEWTHSR